MPSALLSALSAATLSLGVSAGLPAGESVSAMPQPEVIQPEGPQPAGEVDYKADVASVDGIMKALYACTVGPPGEPRDWDRLRNLCHSRMQFMAIRDDGGGGSVVFALTVEDYIQHNKTYFENGGFFEREIARRTESFGNLTQVWSTFESRLGSEAADPYTRGIYSVQLLKDGDRWWILSCAWDMETPDNPLPDKYLGEAEEEQG